MTNEVGTLTLDEQGAVREGTWVRSRQDTAMAASLGGAAGATGSASADLRRFFFAGFFVTSSPAGLAQGSVVQVGRLLHRHRLTVQHESNTGPATQLLAHLTAVIQRSQCRVQQVAEVGHEDGAESVGQRRSSRKEHQRPTAGGRTCTPSGPAAAYHGRI